MAFSLGQNDKLRFLCGMFLLLTIARWGVIIFSKQPILDMTGWWGLPLLSLCQFVRKLWVVLVPVGLLMIFKGQSMNFEVLLPILLLLVAICVLIDVGFNAMPDAVGV